jgi:hypothetical protein
VDRWRLWEEKTGIRAELHAMDWGEAQRRMQAGEFDVIDTIFRNEPRERIYEFSKPYVKLEVPVFFRKDISGITDVCSSDLGWRGTARSACSSWTSRRPCTSCTRWGSRTGSG